MIHTKIIWLLLAAFALSYSNQFKSDQSVSLIVKIRKGSENQTLKSIQRQAKREGLDIQVGSIFEPESIYRIELIHTGNKKEAIQSKIENIPAVLAVEEDLPIEYRNTPNDPDYPEQWDMEIIGAPALWNFTKGGTTALGHEIVVAVIDDGFEFSHTDLEENIWVNPEEIPFNEVDDDQNGYVDDYIGPNIREKNGLHPLKRHGTAVAGIIGAKGNNSVGVSGVNWNIKIMLISNNSKISEVIEAYEYVYNQRKKFNDSHGASGAYVVATNFSAGVKERFGDEFPIWCGIYNTLGQEGVLSVSATTNDDVNIDQVGDMPSTCLSDYLIVVNNTIREDSKADETGLSSMHVDLGAPGDESFTLNLSNSYGSFFGTSAASPHVTGAIALLYSIPCTALIESSISSPSSTALEVKKSILDGVDPLPSLTTGTVSGGRLNVFKSALALQDKCSGSSGPLNIIKVYPSPASDNVFIRYETPDFEPYEFYVFDAVGRFILQETINPPLFSVKEKQLNVADYPAGIYIVSLVKGEDRVYTKFVVF